MWGDVGVGMCVKRFISMIHNRTVGGKRKWFCEGRGGEEGIRYCRRIKGRIQKGHHCALHPPSPSPILTCIDFF